MNQLAQRSKLSFILKVLNGPDKGAVYRLLSHSVKIGRDDENDISLAHDKKCSRYHAVIAMTTHGVEIKNVSGRNILAVNGKEVSSAILAPNSVIQIGDTKLQFNLNSELEAQPKTNNLRSSNQSMSPPSSTGFKKSKRRRPQSDGPSPFFIVSAAGLLVLVYFLMTSNSKKKEIPSIPSNEEVSAQLEKSRQTASELREARKISKIDTREYREAQSAYIKGFRDSQKGQYERARSHFLTCLAIFPQHPLCGQALADANSKFDELVQRYFSLGNGYLSRNQFRQCKSAFRNVMIMQKDKTTDIYREAEAQFQTCDLKERERL